MELLWAQAGLRWAPVVPLFAQVGLHWGYSVPKGVVCWQGTAHVAARARGDVRGGRLAAAGAAGAAVAAAVQ